MSDSTVARPEVREYPFEIFRGDLPDELLRMVEHEKVSRVRLPDGRLVWLVLGYDEVSTVLTDVRFRRRGGAYDTGADCPVRDLSMDGPAHLELRRLAGRAFTPRRIEAYRPRIQALTDELLDRMERRGSPGDLVADLVVPLPAVVICELLGVPAADRERFAEWDRALMAVDTHGSTETADATIAMRAYLGERLAEKRATPGQDLLSAWAEAQAEAQAGDGSLTDEEIIGLAVTVLVGGREIGSISVGMRALFQHPEVMDRLRADPTLLPAAVDELLRYTSLSPTFLEQTVMAPVELGGVPLQVGEVVMPLPWAANRDPARFERPDVLRVDRPPNQHLTFGVGPHYCLGAALGRVEIETAIGTLLRRFPNLRPGVPIDELPWRHERINCGLAAFPIVW